MAELRPGATVGRFRLEREVARGGMGAVWAARDPEANGRLVALKTVIATKSSEKLSQLFVEEARIARAVRHPNLVELYEAGEERGVPYLAMEWVEGLTLRALALRPEELPLSVILRICMEACDGLHAVHEARTDDGAPLDVVHRDVSPHNLLVSIEGRVKVIDFGIAKAKGRIATETTDGVLRGKVRYMSPEHARGSRLDRRADVWSLGVTLLEVTTGTTPFAGEHDVATLVQLLSAEPTIPDHPRLPPCVKAIVERALRRLPEERYPTAREMGTAIETAIATLGEKITRRGVARVVRLRLGTTKTEALPAPSFYGEDEEDVAPTALLKSPLRAPSPEALRRSEENTREATPPAHVLPSPARGFAPPASFGRSNGRFDEPRVGPLPGSENEELTDEELTNVRSIDVVVPASAPPKDARPRGAAAGVAHAPTPTPAAPSRPKTVPLPPPAPSVPPPPSAPPPPSLAQAESSAFAAPPPARVTKPRHDAPTFKIARPGRTRRITPFVVVALALSLGIGAASFVASGSKSSATPPIASAAAPSAAPAESESEAIAIVAPEPPPTASAAPDASASAHTAKTPLGHPNPKKKK